MFSDAFQDTFNKYCSVTTISGVQYISSGGIVSRIFWFIIGIILIILATLLITKSYNDWQEDPILTSVNTNQYSISNLKFPAITICGLGNVQGILRDAQYQQALAYLKSKNITNIITAGTDNNKDKLLLANHIKGDTFAEEIYPGFGLGGGDSIWKMSSPNPSMDEFYFSVISDNSSDMADIEGADEECVGDNLAYDKVTKLCYTLAGDGTIEQASSSGELCSYYDDPFFILYDEQLEALGKLIANDSGPLAVLQKVPFLTNIRRNEETNAFDLTNVFTTNEFSIGMDNTTSPMKYITIETPLNNLDEKCFSLQYDKSTSKFKGNSLNCSSTVKILCASSLGNYSSDSGTQKLNYLLNSRFWKPWEKRLDGIRQKFHKSFKNIGDKKSLESWLDVLWYNQVPCYDTNVHGNETSSSAFLKHCSWKGQEIPCAAIFDPFPTDRGMCCTFNMEKAEKVFQNSTYQRTITHLQSRDKDAARGNTTLPDPYSTVPQAGINKGLSIILDAHTDLLAKGSVTEDFQGFIAHIGSPDHYPLLSLNNILIRPGHHNQVSLSATDVESTDDIINIAVEKRNCYFKEEYHLELHTNYSQASCLLECQMQYAINLTTEMGGSSCVPWFLPKNDTMEMCDPWEAKAFLEYMHDVPDENCSHCLPDCVVTDYHNSVTAIPFRRCDELNLESSFLCSFKRSALIDPPIFGEQVKKEFGDDIPPYASKISSNIRTFGSYGQNVFHKHVVNTYDAYERDIASVNFYFERSTVFQFKRDLRMSSIDFLGLVGGFLGLCNGFSLCSAVEILFWFTYVLWFRMWKHIDKHRNKGQDIEDAGVKNASGNAMAMQQQVNAEKEILALRESINRLEAQIRNGSLQAK